jgi:hypothetical protein
LIFTVHHRIVMTKAQALLASARPANKRRAAGYDRRLAAEIAEMLRDTGVDAQRVLTFVDKMLSLEPQPQGGEPQLPDDA